MVKRNKISQTVWCKPSHKQFAELWSCIWTRIHTKKKRKDNSTQTVRATGFRGEEKNRAFHRRKLTHWCCPCSSLGWLAANIQLLVTFISYRALLLRQQRLSPGLRAQHAAAAPQGTQPIVDSVQKHFSPWAMPPGVLSARRLVFTQQSTKPEKHFNQVK